MEPKPKKVELYIDGASRGNPGPSAIGVIIIREVDGKMETTSFSEKIGKGTNNEAEMSALHKAIEICAENHFDEPLIHTDSMLVANVVIGRWRVRSPLLQKKVEAIAELIMKTRDGMGGYFKPEIKWVPRTDIHMGQADSLCNIELNKKLF
jgi:ribonuclease HI